MNTIKNFIGNFFKNKSIVTIIAFIVCFVIIYIAYQYRVDQKINPVTVPFAKVSIPARTLITSDMVGTQKIPQSMVSSNVIKNKNDVIDKYVNYNTSIPAGSMFYEGSVVTWDKMPDSAWSNIPEGNTIVSLSVNSSTTYGNSIYPGDKIDLYYKSYDDNGKLIVGKLIEGIEVLAVKDSSGNHIFKKTAEQEQTSALIFSVSEELHILLRQAMYLEGDVIPVPRNTVYGESATISSAYLKAFIKSKTIEIPEDVISNNTTNNTTN